MFSLDTMDFNRTIHSERDANSIAISVTLTLTLNLTLTVNGPLYFQKRSNKDKQKRLLSFESSIVNLIYIFNKTRNDLTLLL